MALPRLCHPQSPQLQSPVMVKFNAIERKKEQKEGSKSHLAGLEPATFRLTAERANRLRHKCLPDIETLKKEISMQV